MNHISTVRDPDWMYREDEGCFCSACGDRVLSGEPSYFTGEGHVHEECLKEFVLEEFSTDELARALGFRRS